MHCHLCDFSLMLIQKAQLANMRERHGPHCFVPTAMIGSRERVSRHLRTKIEDECKILQVVFPLKLDASLSNTSGSWRKQVLFDFCVQSFMLCCTRGVILCITGCYITQWTWLWYCPYKWLQFHSRKGSRSLSTESDGTLSMNIVSMVTLRLEDNRLLFHPHQDTAIFQP